MAAISQWSPRSHGLRWWLRANAALFLLRQLSFVVALLRQNFEISLCLFKASLDLVKCCLRHFCLRHLVIASEAKQSMHQRMRSYGLLRRCRSSQLRDEALASF